MKKQKWSSASLFETSAIVLFLLLLLLTAYLTFTFEKKQKKEEAFKTVVEIKLGKKDYVLVLVRKEVAWAMVRSSAGSSICSTGVPYFAHLPKGLGYPIGFRCFAGLVFMEENRYGYILCNPAYSYERVWLLLKKPESVDET